MIQMAFVCSHNRTNYGVRVKNTFAKNAGFASGITLGLGITLGGPYVGHLADIYDVQTALMTLIPVGFRALNELLAKRTKITSLAIGSY